MREVLREIVIAYERNLELLSRPTPLIEVDNSSATDVDVIEFFQSLAPPQQVINDDKTDRRDDAFHIPFEFHSPDDSEESDARTGRRHASGVTVLFKKVYKHIHRKQLVAENGMRNTPSSSFRTSLASTTRSVMDYVAYSLDPNTLVAAWHLMGNLSSVDRDPFSELFRQSKWQGINN